MEKERSKPHEKFLLVMQAGYTILFLLLFCVIVFCVCKPPSTWIELTQNLSILFVLLACLLATSYSMVKICQLEE